MTPQTNSFLARKPIAKFLIIVGLAVSLTLLVLVVLGGVDLLKRMMNPYIDQEISGPGVLSNDWLEITPAKPLRADRIVQQVVIYVEKPITEEAYGWSLVLPDGSRVTPEVELVAEDGNIYELNVPSSATYPNSVEALQRGFGFRGLPKDKLYRKVRLRSAKPVNVLKIVWRCYDPRDII
jgi:hypothetical protein